MTGTGTLLLVGAEVDGVPGIAVRLAGDRIEACGPDLVRRPGERVLDAAGGALLPGLHDHHVHLRAAAAARASTDLAPARTPAELDARLRAAAVERAGPSLAAGAADQVGPAIEREIRALGWDEGAAGPLDRARLDAVTGAVPTRVQHRTGAVWVLNSAALADLAGVGDPDAPGALPDAPEGVGRTVDGRLDGSFTRLDGWLRERRRGGGPTVVTRAASELRAALAGLGREAAAAGVTGFTDATADRPADDPAFFADAPLPQRVLLMARPDAAPVAGGAHPPVKLLLDDTTLPAPPDLAGLWRHCHVRGRPVAVHCVTAEQLLVALAARELAGPPPAGGGPDRIEHAGVVPPGLAGRLAELDLTVVTQPGFVLAHGDRYLRSVEPGEREWLYPAASLAAAGVGLAGSSDAPYGPADPWTALAAAVHRRTAGGARLGEAERLAPAAALDLFLRDPLDPRRRRRVRPGARADLCLLHVPLAVALARPEAAHVRATITAGAVPGSVDG